MNKNKLAQIIGILISLIHLSGAQTRGPEWWYGDNPVVTSDDGNPSTVANVGQGKWFAIKATETLEALDPHIGGNLREVLYKTSPGDPSKVFYPLMPSAGVSDSWREAQRAPLQIGTLKALAYPFYLILNLESPAFVKSMLQENGLVEGLTFFQDPRGYYFPWNPANDQNLRMNRMPATVGQLKLVFALRIYRFQSNGAKLQVKSSYVDVERTVEIVSGFRSRIWLAPLFFIAGISGPNQAATYLQIPTEASPGDWFDTGTNGFILVRNDADIDITSGWNGVVQQSLLRFSRPNPSPESLGRVVITQKFIRVSVTRDPSGNIPFSNFELKETFSANFVFEAEKSFSSTVLIPFPSDIPLGPSRFVTDAVFPVDVFPQTDVELEIFLNEHFPIF